MKRSNIKEAFGGEVSFTSFIAKDQDTHNRLLDAVDMAVSDDYKIIPEDRTVDSKRVDLTVKDSEDETIAVIESQDATGWLDSIHASKIVYYMYEKDCYQAILLTEDADEHVKGFVRFLNENTPCNVFLVATPIYLIKNEPFIDFVPIMRPFNIKDKKITRRGSGSYYSEKAKEYGNRIAEQYAEFLEKKFEEHPGLWTHQTAHYLSRNSLGKNRMNASIIVRRNSFRVMAYHRIYNTETFRSTFSAFCEEIGYEPLLNNSRGYVSVETWDEALEVFNKLYPKLESNEITA